MKYTIKGNIWVERNNEAFMGAGRILLLEEIQKTGSITTAAKSIKMSYRQAWDLVNSINKMAKKPLVERTSGGVNGGGTSITAEGVKVINTYRKLQLKFQQFQEKETALLNKHFK